MSAAKELNPQSSSSAFQPILTMPTPEMIAAAIAHRSCCGTEHDPSQGKLHGCCVVCGEPWPCETASSFIFKPNKVLSVSDGKETAMPDLAMSSTPMLECSDQEDDALIDFVRQLQEAATEYLRVTRTRGNGEPSHYITPANRSVEQVKAAENRLRDFLKNTPNIPNPPPNRIILDSGGVGVCKFCGSSLIRKPWLFGKVKCVQPLCKSNTIN